MTNFFSTYSPLEKGARGIDDFNGIVIPEIRPQGRIIGDLFFCSFSVLFHR